LVRAVGYVAVATVSPAALVTGGSRGIGAATVMALARRGLDVAFTYRSRKRRADQVVAEASATGRRVLAIASDMTDPEATARLFDELRGWTERLDVLVLNASGGLEPGMATDPHYPMKINRDAQVAFVQAARPLLAAGVTVVLVTSHWAHRYGAVVQFPAYEPIARSKQAGELALRELAAGGPQGFRLLVVTGDLVEGTVTSKLLERASRGIAVRRRREVGVLPSAADMGEAIATAALDSTLPSGRTVVVGGSLDSLPRSPSAPASARSRVCGDLGERDGCCGGS
jgi:NAD(P)-dependent dehydrogenase (short-subunit alcohol dehydrogenase family)